MPLFTPLSDAQRVKLAQNTESASFAAGEVILREGDPATPPHDGFYLLQSGEVVCHLPEKETDPSSPGHTVALRKLAMPSSPRRPMYTMEAGSEVAGHWTTPNHSVTDNHSVLPTLYPRRASGEDVDDAVSAQAHRSFP